MLEVFGTFRGPARASFDMIDPGTDELKTVRHIEFVDGTAYYAGADPSDMETLHLALHMAAFAETPVRGSQHWIDLAKTELRRRKGVNAAAESGLQEAAAEAERDSSTPGVGQSLP